MEQERHFGTLWMRGTLEEVGNERVRRGKGESEISWTRFFYDTHLPKNVLRDLNQVDPEVNSELLIFLLVFGWSWLKIKASQFKLDSWTGTGKRKKMPRSISWIHVTSYWSSWEETSTQNQTHSNANSLSLSSSLHWRSLSLSSHLSLS